jgi:hypothetical protein
MLLISLFSAVYTVSSLDSGVLFSEPFEFDISPPTMLRQRPATARVRRLPRLSSSVPAPENSLTGTRFRLRRSINAASEQTTNEIVSSQQHHFIPGDLVTSQNTTSPSEETLSLVTTSSESVEDNHRLSATSFNASSASASTLAFRSHSRPRSASSSQASPSCLPLDLNHSNDKLVRQKVPCSIRSHSSTITPFRRIEPDIGVARQMASPSQRINFQTRARSWRFSFAIGFTDALSTVPSFSEQSQMRPSAPKTSKPLSFRPTVRLTKPETETNEHFNRAQTDSIQNT